ncbi:MAG: alpha/beta hydrolase [Zavarzinia sp.]|nr:alpha/beta hydrolase [Zavarzinia sp.]
MASVEGNSGALVVSVAGDRPRKISLRARLLRAFLRRTFKNRIRFDIPVQVVRAQVEKLSRRLPPPPADVKVIDIDAGGVPGHWIEPDNATEGRHILYLHGGGYVMCSPKTHLGFTWRIAKAAAARMLVIDYRLAPEFAFPAQIDDSLTGYRFMLDSGIPAERIAIMGDSAGGGLTFGLLMRLKALGLPMPGAAVGLSPYLDLTVTGESHYLHAKSDPMIPLPGVIYGSMIYLQGADPKHPEASPIFGEASGLPPTLIHVGSDEVLLSDSTRMVANLRAAGVPVEIDVWHRMPHVWHAFARYIPEGRAAIDKIGQFLRQTIR